MPIKVHKEPHMYYGATRTYEKCIFCGCGTQYWNEAADTSICPSCAEKHEESDIDRQLFRNEFFKPPTP